MRLLRIFSIGANKILRKNCCVKGSVILVEDSYIHVVKKPVRLTVTPENTILSHYITFRYQVAETAYTGKLYVDLRYRCPQKGEQIDVYYDPEKPENYACYAFGPGVNPIGW